MAWPTHYYVRPTNGSDTPGGGTSHATAYQTTQYCFDDITATHGWDSAVGAQVNICDEAADLITTPLTIAFAPANNAQLIIRGYTETANDGGQGHWDGNANNTIIFDGVTPNKNCINFYDMKIGNTGTAQAMRLRWSCNVINCEIYDAAAAGTEGALYVWNACTLLYNHFHGISGTQAVSSAHATHWEGNYIADCTATYLFRGYQSQTWYGNFLRLSTGTQHGINVADECKILHNSLMADSGNTGRGLYFDNAGRTGLIIQNNIFAGFNGVGAYGCQVPISANTIVQNNAFYDCTTPIMSGQIQYYDADTDTDGSNGNELSLAADPFQRLGPDTFANRFRYFRPVKTGNVVGGAWPAASGLNKGAVQTRPVLLLGT